MPDSQNTAPSRASQTSRSSRWLVAAVVIFLVALAAWWLLGGALADQGKELDIDIVLPDEMDQFESR